MLIWLITHFFPPTYNAGTENYTLNLARELQTRGHDVQVLCAEDWQSGDDYWNGVTNEKYKDILVRRIHLNWLKARDSNRILYDSPQVEEWLDRFLDSTRFDIVHVTSAISLGIGVLHSVRRAYIPLVLTLTDFWFICPNTKLLRHDRTVCDGKTTAWECQSCLLAGSHVFNRLNGAAIPESAALV